jgi:Rrf2 family nitric oxide-sensitive transcriptional repressor
MRLTTRTNLAIRTLMYCAANPDLVVRKADVAYACNASENHLAQVIRMLVRLGFIEAARGRNGGMKLARETQDICIGAVFRGLESELPVAECFSDTNTCPLVHACWLRNALRDAVEAFYGSLDKVTLSDLVDDNDALAALLRVHKAPGCAGRRNAQMPADVVA